MRTEALDATDGTRIWRSSFSGPDGQSAYAREIALAPDGAAVYVTGWREGDDVGGADIATICYDAVTGAELWVATYAGPDSGYDFSTQLDVAPDGSMVFVGGSVDQGGIGEWALLAYEGA